MSQLTQLDTADPGFEFEHWAVRLQSPSGSGTSARLVCRFDGSERSLPRMCSPRAMSPWLNWDQEAWGLRPVGSHPGDKAPASLLDPRSPQVWAGAPGHRQERAPQQRAWGVRTAEPGSFRRLQPSFLCSWVLPRAQPPVRPPTSGPVFPGWVTWCGSALLWGRARCQEQPAGKGPRSGNGVSTRFGRGPTVHGGVPDFQLGSLSLARRCMGLFRCPPARPSLCPPPARARPSVPRLPAVPLSPTCPYPSRGHRPVHFAVCVRSEAVCLRAKSCRVSPALLDTGRVTLDRSRPPGTWVLICV